MKVRDIMTTDVRACRPEDTLEVAARIMWDHDCGCLPVLGRDDRVQAMITDRDVCMAAWSKGRALRELHVFDSMSPGVITCRPEDDLEEAAAQMVKAAVRRLPVVGPSGKLSGILALNDLACATEPGSRKALRDEPAAGALGVLTAVCRHRPSRTGPETREIRPAAKPAAPPPPVKAEAVRPPAALAAKPAPQPAAKPKAKTGAEPAAKTKPPKASGGKTARA